MKQEVKFKELEGQTIKTITNTIDTLNIETIEGNKYEMYHERDCCESVVIEDVDGDLQDLIGYPILLAEETKEIEDDRDSFTWTFYKLRNVKASVTIRWFGTSNGYYSENVSFFKTN